MISDLVQIALISLGAAAIAAVPPTIVAWASFKAALKTSEKTEIVLQKTAEIHVLANSNLAKSQAETLVANEQNKGATSVIVELRKQIVGLLEDKRALTATRTAEALAKIQSP